MTDVVLRHCRSEMHMVAAETEIVTRSTTGSRARLTNLVRSRDVHDRLYRADRRRPADVLSVHLFDFDLAEDPAEANQLLTWKCSSGLRIRRLMPIARCSIRTSSAGSRTA